MIFLVVGDDFVILTLVLLQSHASAASRHHQRWLLSLTVCAPSRRVTVILTPSLDTVRLLRVAAYRRVTVHLRGLVLLDPRMHTIRDIGCRHPEPSHLQGRCLVPLMCPLIYQRLC